MTPRVRSRAPRFSQHKLGSALTGAAFLLPLLLPMALFVYYPLVQGFIYSFQEVNLVTPAEFIGWDNFTKVMDLPGYWPAWRNTFLYSVLIVFGSNILPLIPALFIHEARWGRSFFQLAVYLPAMTPPMVTILLWDWVFDPGNGLANTLLGVFGIGPQGFLTSQAQALPSIALIATWSGWGFACLIYLAGLSNVPSELYEAAEIDGATRIQMFRYVTLPHVRVQLVMLTLLGILSCMQLFSQPFVLTGGGPAHATITIAQLIYQQAFTKGDLGGASALALQLMIVLVTMSVLFNWGLKRVSR